MKVTQVRKTVNRRMLERMALGPLVDALCPTLKTKPEYATLTTDQIQGNLLASLLVLKNDLARANQRLKKANQTIEGLRQLNLVDVVEAIRRTKKQ